jgi:hypothetical protein
VFVSPLSRTIFTPDQLERMEEEFHRYRIQLLLFLAEPETLKTACILPKSVAVG